MISREGDAFPLNRRAFLSATGALVVSIAVTPAESREGAPPLTPDNLDSYVSVEPDGVIVARYGKIDGGQGLATSIAQIVAEELDVDCEKVRVVMGDSALTLNMGGASGATGVAKGGATLRNAAAEARRLLVNMASRALGVSSENLVVDEGVVSVAGAPQTSVSYASLVGGGYFNATIDWNGKTGTDLVAKGLAAPKRPEQYRIVGKSFPRRDIPGKVFGESDFVNDVRLPGMLHARMIRPAVAGATPLVVDEASIANIPGARVVRIKDLLAVVAPREWNAVRAANALKVVWSESRPNFPGHEKLHDHIRAAPVVKRKIERQSGSLEAGLALAACVIEAEYEAPTQSHSSMGPACAVADVRPDGATLWTSTQKPHYARDGVAKLVGLPVDRVRAIWMFGTGSYGRNDQGDAGADAALLSKELGKPVRVQYTRREGIAWDPKSTASVVRSRAGLDAAGKVIAWEHVTKGFSRVNTDTKEGKPAATLAGQLTGAAPEPAQDLSVPVASYGFENARLSWETIPPLMERASPLRTTHLRDPHGAPVLFGSEGFMDELAAVTGMDPVAFRLANLRHPRELAVVKAVAERADWRERASPRSDQGNAPVARGRGVALRRHSSTFIALVAEVAVHRDTGRVEIERLVCAADVGLVVNPRILRHVMECQLVYGASRALFEEVRFDADMVTSVDWNTYPVLRIDSAPKAIDIVVIDRPEMASSGAAEMGPGLVAPAVGNAIFDATGARPRRFPMTPERVLAALEARDGAKGSK